MPDGLDNPRLMVTPWNLPKCRDLGRYYLTLALLYLSLMDQATQAHQRAQDSESKWGHQQSYEHFRRMALHAHKIATDLFFEETTLGKNAPLVKLAHNYSAMSQQEADSVLGLYEQAASQLCELLSANETESAATLLIEHAMAQAKQALAARGRRKRSACEICKRGDLRCVRGKALHRVMQGQLMYIRVQRAHLRPVFLMSEQDVRHLAAAHAAAISAAGDWHLHLFGSSTGS